MFPEKDPAVIAREWRQGEWLILWGAQGREWSRQTTASAWRRLSESTNLLAVEIRRCGHAIGAAARAMKGFTAAMESSKGGKEA